MNSSYARYLTVVLSFFFTTTFFTTTHAQTLQAWQMSWPSVESDSAHKCAKVFDQFQLQAVCMENEKRGYDKMQSDFGMPSDISIRAKEKCAKVFDQFQLQAVCMENERKGYEKMKKYS